MTTYEDETLTCAICGGQSRHSVLMSTNAFGSPDLDLRPPQMKRSTMHHWLQECPHCGYVAADLAQADPEVRALVRGPDWMALQKSAIAPAPLVGGKFLIHAAIQAAIDQPAAAANSMLCAAWECDDGGIWSAEAQACRRRAADHFKRALAENRVEPARMPTVQLVLLDVLRRAQLWDAARAHSDTIDGAGLDNIMAAVLRFERRLIEKRDDRCYTVADAERG